MPNRMERWAAVLIVAVLAGTAWGEGSQGITKPSEEVTLSFARPGRVAAVLVKDGEPVKAGQAVVQLDDREERAMLAVDEAAATDTSKMRGQESIRDQKEVDRKRIEAMAPGIKTPY